MELWKKREKIPLSDTELESLMKEEMGCTDEALAKCLTRSIIRC
jgi:hypothetical protein